jgi:hypothetical protein
MYLSKFVHSETGRYIMSIILGLGLATIFRAVCEGKSCTTTAAPPLEEIDDKIYRFDNKCYKFEKKAVNCNKNRQILNFA